MLAITHTENEVRLSFKNNSRINVLNNEFIKEFVIRILDKTKKQYLVIDLDNINFIDSAGFGMLLEVLKLADMKEKRILFCNISNELSELIELVKLQHQFRLHEPIYDALEY